HKLVRSAVAQGYAPSDAAQTPYDYLIAVMRDPSADVTRRDRAAATLMPYVMARIADRERGMKELADLAGGAPPPPGSEWAKLLNEKPAVVRPATVAPERDTSPSWEELLGEERAKPRPN